MTEDQRVLAVSFEPWDTQISMSVLQEMQNRGLRTHLVVGDLWQTERKRAFAGLKHDPHYSPGNVSLVASNPWRFHRAVKHLENLTEDALTAAIREFLPLPPEQIKILIATDHIFNCEDRKPYYYPMTYKAQLAVVLLMAKQIAGAFNALDPTNLLLLGRNYLAKNIAAEMACRRNIPIHVVYNARVSNYIWATSFWPAQNGSLLVDIDIDTQPGLDIHRLRHRSREPLYVSQSSRDLSALQYSDYDLKGGLHQALKPLISFLRFILGLFRNRRRFIATASTVIFRTYASSRTRTTAYKVLRAARKWQFRHCARSNAFDRLSTHNEYLLIVLHTRPESSTLTLGAGKRDEDAIEAVADAVRVLNLRMPIYALENPSSIGDNRRHLYAFCRSRGVKVLSPIEDTQALLRDATAVFAISGTALLEADLAGVPSFAFGLPEFAPVLASWGLNLYEFLDAVKDRKPLPFGRSARLLSWFQTYGIVGTLGWEGVRSVIARQRSAGAVMEALEQANFFASAVPPVE